MATEARESFPVLEDASTNAGLPLHKTVEGDVIGTRNNIAALPAKDASGNHAWLNLDSNGKLITTQEGIETCLESDGTIEDGSASSVLLCEITLQASKVYRGLEFFVSCNRNAKFVIEHIDDEGGLDTINVLVPAGRVGPGHYNAGMHFDCKKFTSGATGVQKLRIMAYNHFGALSDIDGTISVSEVQ